MNKEERSMEKFLPSTADHHGFIEITYGSVDEFLERITEDLSAVQRILEVLEREAEVMKILAGASGTSIQIGAELPVHDVDLAVVSKTYEVGSAGGSVGVIGPMRMNYKRAISAVEEVSRELEDRIGSEHD